MKKVILAIEGMTCSACSNGLEKYLNKQEGIKKATVNLVMNNASIEYDETILSMEDLDRFVKKAGFKSLGIDTFQKELKKQNNQKYILSAISFFAILNLYISMGHMINLPTIPFIDSHNNPTNYAISLFVITTIVLLLCFDIIKNGIKNLIHKTPNMDTLVTIGVFASFIYSTYKMITLLNGTVQMAGSLYFESASTVLFFIKIGKFIENNNKNKTREALQKLVTITPKNATIIKAEKELTVTIDEIQKGDIVVCKPGEKIAVDGTVVNGQAHVDESFITGESLPVKKTENSKVIAGSINYDGTIKYKAEKIGKESTISEIVKQVNEMTSTKAPISKIADIVSGFFVPLIIIIAIISFIVWFIITKDFSFSINSFISVLLVACPCSLGLATPLAIVIASSMCSSRGILVKSAETLENAHKIKTICFDKTGTITNGDLRVYKIFKYDDENEKDIMQAVCSIEKNSEHPIASAFSKYAIESNLKITETTDFKVFSRYGHFCKN